MRQAWLIARRDLRALFTAPLAWVLGAVYALLCGYFFYSDVTYFVLFGGANYTKALWRFVFLDFRLITILVVPLLTMRLLSEERRLGTLELLFTFPVPDGAIIGGKFVAAFGTYLLYLASTLVGPALLYSQHQFPIPPVLAGYLGMAFLGAVAVAVGLAASALTEHQGVSAMTTYGVLLMFWFLSWNESALGQGVAPYILALSLFDRFYGFAQGVIDSRDVVYFVTMTAVGLWAARWCLASRAWRGIG
jgi:ABC-2 type transport system permease protein